MPASSNSSTVLGNKHCIPPPDSSNHGAISPAFTLIGSTTSNTLYGFMSVPGASALISYGIPSGEVNVPKSLPYLRSRL